MSWNNPILIVKHSTIPPKSPQNKPVVTGFLNMEVFPGNILLAQDLKFGTPVVLAAGIGIVGVDRLGFAITLRR